MKYLFLIVITIVFSISAYASSSEAYIEIFKKMDEACAGNDNGSVAKFNPKLFSAKKISKELKSQSYMDCGRTFSVSKSDGTKALLTDLFDRTGLNAECVMDALDEEEQDALRTMIVDKTNLGVFANQWDGEKGDSEYCMYNHYSVYRADGTVFHFVFNHTD